MNIYYVYQYLREDNTPYYIGKGKEKRAWQQHKRANGSDLRPRDHSRIQIVEQNLTEQQAWNLEAQLIHQYGKIVDGGILVNSNNGGEGGRVLPPGSRAGSKNPMYGKSYPCTKQKQLAISRTKNLPVYDLYRQALNLMNQGIGADDIAKKLGIGRGICFRLKNGTHGIFFAFPELKQTKTC
jgi:hypothetical protein